MSEIAQGTAAPAPAPATEAVPTTTQTEAPATTTVAAPEAPQTAKDAAAKWAKPKAPQGKTAKEARDSIARRVNAPRETERAVEAVATPTDAPAPEAATDAQPRDEMGRFAPKDEAAVETPAVESPATGRIAIPEGHTIRETRGKTYLDELELHELKPFVAPEVWENISASLRAKNTAQAEAQRTKELERQLAEQRARAEVLSDPATDPLANPETRALYEDIKRAYGPEQAEQYLEAVKGKREQIVATKAAELARSMEAANAARSFLDSVKEVKDTYARSRYTAWGDNLDASLNGVLEIFVPLVEQGKQEPTREAFYRFADMLYVQSPAGKAAVEAQARAQQQKLAAEAAETARRQAEEQAKAAEAERLKLAAANRRTIPLAGLPSGGAVVPNNRPASAAEARKNLNERYRSSLTR